MKLEWHIEPEDVKKVQALMEAQKDNVFVRTRVERNLSGTKPTASKADFWFVMVRCMLTSQQRSGPHTPVGRFINTRPFPLGYETCACQDDLKEYIRGVISGFGGLRFCNRIASQASANYQALEGGLWAETSAVLEELRWTQTAESERKAADFIDDRFKGFGPKQSRNLLQLLALTRYEIPIDSRITKWLNTFGFPVHLSSDLLSNRAYYHFCSDAIQELCARCGVYPCVLDAAIFSSFDNGAWTDGNILW